MYKPLVLAILDGWGYSEETDHNAIHAAHTPTWDALWQGYPHALVDASEEWVGLPVGQMGNSEVGHMNIGGGRILLQDLPRIDNAILDGSLAKNPKLQAFIATLQNTGGACHLMGLLSDGGVHAHMHHMAALAEMVSKQGVDVWVHVFLDGRDTPPKSAEQYLTVWQKRFPETDTRSLDKGLVRIATVSGRYYAMDRDKRWERVEKAYTAIVHGEGHKFSDALAALQASYKKNETDEFVIPAAIGQYAGSGMQDGDGLLMANFRADRARQILQALLKGMPGKKERGHLVFAATLGMVEYSSELAPLMPALFPPETPKNMLGEILSNAGLKQLRIAETEKYAHVTFFFNGGREEPFPGEERILVPSPKVATYDLKPEMSAFEVMDKLVAAIEKNLYDVVIVNFANTDMVGHTGDMNAAKKAVEAVDTCLGKIKQAVDAVSGVMVITADHGNAEDLMDESSGQMHTAHTLNKVPLIVAGKNITKQNTALKDGRLCDIAPTILALLGMTQPKEMTGHSLMQPKAAGHEQKALP